MKPTHFLVLWDLRKHRPVPRVLFRLLGRGARTIRRVVTADFVQYEVVAPVHSSTSLREQFARHFGTDSPVRVHAVSTQRLLSGLTVPQTAELLLRRGLQKRRLARL